jgi:hypothetical protein
MEARPDNDAGNPISLLKLEKRRGVSILKLALLCKLFNSGVWVEIGVCTMWEWRIAYVASPALPSR